MKQNNLLLIWQMQYAIINLHKITFDPVGLKFENLSLENNTASLVTHIFLNTYSGGQNKVGQVLLRNLAKIELSKPGLL
jgi:hypothetical protein